MAKEKFTRNIGTHPDISKIGKQYFTSEETSALTSRIHGLLHLENTDRPRTSSLEKYNIPEIMEKEEF